MLPPSSDPRDPWVVRAGRWLTKRRGIILAPLFAVALLAARKTENPLAEWGQDLLGILCIVGGTWLRLVAAGYHESSHRSEPITAGPYAWVRHPLYLANFLLGLGIMLIAGWWPMVAVYLLVFLPVHLAIARGEEEHLVKLYGEKYEAYRRAVPAILPCKPFHGSRYGSRSSFKLKKGREGVKVIGYAAGAAALLASKRWRYVVPMPPLRPLPIPNIILASAITVLAVLYRPRMRWAWMRGCQTAAVIGCVLSVALHTPGVWPASRLLPASISIPAASPMHLPSEQGTPAPDTEAAVAVPISPRATADGDHAAKSKRSVPQPTGFLNGSINFLWDHLDVVGGAAALGIAAMVEAEREEHAGKALTTEDFINEIGPVGLGVAAALSVLKQWRDPSAITLSNSDDDPWRLKFSPAYDRGGVTVLATFNRRF